MAIKITIPARLPSLNDYVLACRSNKFDGAHMKRDTEDICIPFIRIALRNKKLDRIGLTFRWLEKNRKRDKDNICFAKKFILDGMQKAGILQNDGWKQIEYFKDEFDVDKDNPRVEILIEEML